MSVTWEEPIAVDNVQIRSVESSHHPGTFFTVVHSPHRITYHAEDTSSNQATCTFLIVIEYEAQRASASRQVSFDDIQSIGINSFALGEGGFVQSIYADTIISPDIQMHHQYNLTARFHETNQIDVQFAPPWGDLFEVVFGETLVRARFAVDLTFVLTNELQSSPHNMTKFSSLKTAPLPVPIATELLLSNVTRTSTTAVEFTAGEINDIDSAFFQDDQGQNILRFDSDEQTGILFENSSDLHSSVHGFRLRGTSAIFTESFTFSRLTVRLKYPGLFDLMERRSRSIDHGEISDLGSETTTNDMYVLVEGSTVHAEYLFVQDMHGMNDASLRTNGFLTLSDDVPPTYGTTCPENITVAAPFNATVANVSWTEPVATDNRRVVSNTGTITPPALFLLSNDPINKGESVVYTAVDQFGLTATCTFNVQVIDVWAPVVSCPEAQTLVADESTGLASLPSDLTWPTSISDSGSLYNLHSASDINSLYTLVSSLFLIDRPITDFEIGNHQATISVTDGWKNTGSCIFTVTVLDVTPPQSSNCPNVGPSVVSSEGDAVPVQWNEILWEDNSGVPNATASHNSGDLFPVGVTTVVIEATDPSNNVALCKFNVTVQSSIESQGSDGSGRFGNMSASEFAGTVVAGVSVLAILVVIVVVLVLRARKQPHDFEAILEEMKTLKALYGIDGDDSEGPVRPCELKRAHIVVLQVLGRVRAIRCYLKWLWRNNN